MGHWMCGRSGREQTGGSDRDSGTKDSAHELVPRGREGVERRSRPMMLLPRSVRVYVATTPANLHQSFDGLSNQVRSALSENPLSGHLFIFLNRRRNQVKIFVW